jgi:hypothetical protein
MNPVCKFPALLISLAFLVTGCSKNSDAKNSMTGKIDGVDFTCGSTAKANKPEHNGTGQDDPVLRITGNFNGYSIKLIIILYNAEIHTGYIRFCSGG